MDKFEKLAQLIEDLGEILCVPGVAEALEKAGKEKNPVRQRGMMLRCTAMCAQKAPDVVCRLLASDLDKPVEEVQAMPENELMGGMMRLMNTVIAPFIFSASKQETKP